MKKRRLLAGLLAFAMTVTSISFNAFAEEAAPEAAATEEVAPDETADDAADAVVDEAADDAADDAVQEAEDDAVVDEAEADDSADAADDAAIEDADDAAADDADAAVPSDSSEIVDDSVLGEVVDNAVESEGETTAEADEYGIAPIAFSPDMIEAMGAWQGAIFGNSVSGDNCSPENESIKASSEKDVELMAKKGKVAKNQEGIVFYYQEATLDDDFTLSADATVVSYKNDNQVAFGLQMRDDVFESGTDPGNGNYGTSIAAGPFRLATSGAYKALGYYRGNGNGDNVNLVPNADPEKETGDAATAAKLAVDGKISTGNKIHLELAYNHTFNTVTLTVGKDSTTLNIDDFAYPFDMNGPIYVGPFVSREADVQFSNLDLTIGTPVYEVEEWIDGTSSGKNNTFTVTPTSDASGNPTSVKFEQTKDNSGKVSDDSEQYAYYVGKLNSKANFTLSAKMTIDNFISSGSNNNQTAFGLVLRSTVDQTDSSYTGTVDGTTADGNLHSPGAMLAFIPAEKKVDLDGDTVAETDVQGASIRARGYDKDGAVESKPTFTPIANYTIATGQVYDVSISKSGDSYTFVVADEAGNQNIAYLSSTNAFGSDIYPGFFAGRNVSVTFSDTKLEVDNRQVQRVWIEKQPTQTEYYIGEAFNPEGMVVKAEFLDPVTGETSESELTEADYTMNGFDTTTLGSHTMQIVKGSQMATLEYTVRKKRVTAIDLKYAPTLNRYYEYQPFEKAGYEGTVIFEDGSSEALSDDNMILTVDGQPIDETKYWRASEAGVKTVYVSYAETDTLDPNGVQASFNLTILPYVLTDLSVGVLPVTTEYFVNMAEDRDDEGNLKGLIIRGVYRDANGNFYYDYLSPSVYTVSGFHSDVIGQFNWTIALNSDPSISITLPYKVNTVVTLSTDITRYPRTTYDVGTSLQEIASQIFANTVITQSYSDDTTKDFTADEYIINMSELGGDSAVTMAKLTGESGISGSADAEGTYTVTIGFNDPTVPELAMDITIWDAPEHYWKVVRFGASAGDKDCGVTFNAPQDDHGLSQDVEVYSNNGAGKITNSGHDGMEYYYTRVNAENNFEISADIKVVNYMSGGKNETRTSQDAFGIMARDNIPLKPRSDYGPDLDTYENMKPNSVVQTVNAAVDENGEPIPQNDGSDYYGNIVLAGAYAESNPKAPTTASGIPSFNSNRLKIYARSGITDADGGGAIQEDVYLLYNGSEFGDYITGDYANNWEYFCPKAGDVYHITLTRLNDGYYMESTILAVGEENARYADRVVGRTFSSAYNMLAAGVQEDPLLVQNSDTIYVGFFAARNGDIEVSNIELNETNVETDLNTTGVLEDVQNAGFSIVSPLYTENTDYSLIIKANNKSGGYATIKLGDEVVANRMTVAKKATSIGLKLQPNTVYDLTVTYVPNLRDILSSEEPMTEHYKLYCVNGANVTESGTYYVAPAKGYGEPDGGVYGDFRNSGTIDSPLELDAALALIKAGEKIIMLDGTYLRDSVVQIAETNFGFTDKMKYLEAENDRKVTIDFQGNSAGLDVRGDCWWIKGIRFLHSADKMTGGQLSASDCVIENCVFAESGTTGFQVSGNSADRFAEWPSNNLILNCESYNSIDSSGQDADGFGCKLTVGNGNVFKGCVSHNNQDDGWDLYTKGSSGPIGSVILEDCVSYDDSLYLVTKENAGNPTFTDINGVTKTWLTNGQTTVVYNGADPTKYTPGEKIRMSPNGEKSSSRNGFKLGGESIYVQHYIKDSYSFGNNSWGIVPAKGTIRSGKGIDSNSNPAMKVRNVISYNNACNFGLSSAASSKTVNYNIDGAISIAPFGTPKATQSGSNYVWSGFSYGDSILTYNSKNDEWTNEAYSSEALARRAQEALETNKLLTYVLTLHYDTTPVMIESPTNWLVKSADSTQYTWGTSRLQGERTPDTVAGLDPGSHYVKPGDNVVGYAGYNSEGEEVTPDWFVSTSESDAIDQYGFIIDSNNDNVLNADDFKTNGFLQLTPEHQYQYKECDIPQYNALYRRYFGLDPEPDQPTVPEEPTTSAPAPSTPSGGSSGGSGGGSSSGGGGGKVTTTSKVGEAAAPGDTPSTGEETVTPSTPSAPSAPVEVPKKASGAAGTVNPPAATNASTGFDDIGTTPWASGSINRLASAGIINGVSANEFKPDGQMTRGDFCVLIDRLLGLDKAADSPFDDVDSSKYYADAVANVTAAGIAQGYDDDTFQPEKLITRQEMFVLIAKVYDYMGYNINASTSVLNKFADGADVAAWAAPYAAFLAQYGIVNGSDANTINPTVAITRAETAVLLEPVYDAALDAVQSILDAVIDTAVDEEAAEETEADEAASEEESVEEDSEATSEEEASEEESDAETEDASEESTDEAVEA